MHLLLDSGNYRRLEQIGGVTVSRPCPSAHWSPGLPPQDWHADVSFLSESGEWKWSTDRVVGQDWTLDSDVGFSLSLWPGTNGQLGAFVEQQDNWDWLRKTCEARGHQGLRVLNLFAYTGGSTLACAAAGNCHVVHVDGSRGVVSRARNNAERSGLQCITWLVEDVLTYVERAFRRGEKFDAVVLE